MEDLPNNRCNSQVSEVALQCTDNSRRSSSNNRTNLVGRQEVSLLLQLPPNQLQSPQSMHQLAERRTHLLARPVVTRSLPQCHQTHSEVPPQPVCSSRRTPVPSWMTMMTRQLTLVSLQRSRRRRQHSSPRRPKRRRPRLMPNFPSRANPPRSSSWTTYQATRGTRQETAVCRPKSSQSSSSPTTRRRVSNNR